jgi:hypothetical protein
MITQTVSDRWRSEPVFHTKIGESLAIFPINDANVG